MDEVLPVFGESVEEGVEERVLVSVQRAAEPVEEGFAFTSGEDVGSHLCICCRYLWIKYVFVWVFRGWDTRNNWDLIASNYSLEVFWASRAHSSIQFFR